MKKILCINGSASPAGSNNQLLEQIANSFSAPFKIDVYNELHELPLFTPQKLKAGVPETVLELKSRVKESDALVISTPEYLHNIPAALKNALEWMTESGELAEKSILAMTLTPHQPRGASAMNSLLQSLKASKANVVAELPLYQNELRSASGIIQLDETTKSLLQEALKLL